MTTVGSGWKDCFEMHYVLEQIPVDEPSGDTEMTSKDVVSTRKPSYRE